MKMKILLALQYQSQYPVFTLSLHVAGLPASTDLRSSSLKHSFTYIMMCMRWKSELSVIIFLWCYISSFLCLWGHWNVNHFSTNVCRTWFAVCCSIGCLCILLWKESFSHAVGSVSISIFVAMLLNVFVNGICQWSVQLCNEEGICYDPFRCR